MLGLQSFLERAEVSIFDEREWLASDRLSPFAWSDVFLREMSANPGHLLVHLWPMSNTVILGMLDKQLPYLKDGLTHLRYHGYYPVVRNIGGLAVVADEGVLNISLVFSQAEMSISIKAAYDLWLEVIRQVFWDCPYPIEAYEIRHSYCPGAYDLSVKGRKIAGLAQRRIKDGILVSIYLSVSGHQDRRGQLIRDFYQLAQKDDITTSRYPHVRPADMTTITEVYQREWTVAEVCERLQILLQQYSQSVSPYHMTSEQVASYQLFYEDMLKRNKEVLSNDVI